MFVAAYLALKRLCAARPVAVTATTATVTTVTATTVQAPTVSISNLPDLALMEILSYAVGIQATRLENKPFEKLMGHSYAGSQIETWSLIYSSHVCQMLWGVNKQWRALLSKQDERVCIMSSQCTWRNALFERAVAHSMSLIKRQCVPRISGRVSVRFTAHVPDSRFDVTIAFWRMSGYGCLDLNIRFQEGDQREWEDCKTVYFPLEEKDARASDAERAFRSENEIAALHVWTHENQSLCVAALQDTLHRLRGRMAATGAVPRILNSMKS